MDYQASIEVSGDEYEQKDLDAADVTWKDAGTAGDFAILTPIGLTSTLPMNCSAADVAIALDALGSWLAEDTPFWEWPETCRQFYRRKISEWLDRPVRVW